MSGVDSYSSLCVAAKSEERRLQELRKRQQYNKVATPSTKPPPRTPQTGKSRGVSTAHHQGDRSKSSVERRTCYTWGICGRL